MFICSLKSSIHIYLLCLKPNTYPWLPTDKLRAVQREVIILSPYSWQTNHWLRQRARWQVWRCLTAKSMKNVWIIGCLTEYVKHNVQQCKIANNIRRSIFLAMHTFWGYRGGDSAPIDCQDIFTAVSQNKIRIVLKLLFRKHCTMKVSVHE